MSLLARIDKEGQVALWERWQASDTPRDLDALVMEFEPMVVHVAHRWQYWERYHGDMEQVLRIEVWRAVCAWCPDGGTDLGSYVYTRLDGCHRHFIRDQSACGMRKVPRGTILQVLSLECPIGSIPEEGDPFVGAVNLCNVDTYRQAEFRILWQQLRRCVEEELHPRAWPVWELYTGFHGPPLSQPAIAKEFKLSQMQICRDLQAVRRVLQREVASWL